MTFKVNDAHKEKHKEEISDMIDSMPYDRDYDDLKETANEIVEYFCNWVEKIINIKDEKNGKNN